MREMMELTARVPLSRSLSSAYVCSSTSSLLPFTPTLTHLHLQDEETTLPKLFVSWRHRDKGHN